MPDQRSTLGDGPWCYKCKCSSGWVIHIDAPSLSQDAEVLIARGDKSSDDDTCRRVYKRPHKCIKRQSEHTSRARVPPPQLTVKLSTKQTPSASPQSHNSSKFFLPYLGMPGKSAGTNDSSNLRPPRGHTSAGFWLPCCHNITVTGYAR